MLNRAAYSTMAIEHGRVHGDDWISSGDPLPDFEIPAAAIHPRNVVEPLELLLPLTVLPSYVAALAARLAYERGETGVVAAGSVFRRLVDSIDFVPQLAWLSTALLFLGDQKLRRELRQSLFKFQKDDARRACLSAGWDLGYLQLLSIARAPSISACFEGRTPVLVTEDRQLAPTAILAHCVGDSPVFEVEVDQLDEAWAEEAFDFMAECGRERLFGGTLPEWSACAEAITELERELGIEGPRLGTWGKKVEVEVPREHYREFLLLLRHFTVESLLDSPRQFEGTSDMAQVQVVAELIADNARARERLLEATKSAVFGTLVAEKKSAVLINFLNMVWAYLQRDGVLVNAFVRKIDAEGLYDLVFFTMWKFGRDILADTAEARGVSIDVLLDRALEHFDEATDKRGVES